MQLVITIDTEEDEWGAYARPKYSLENIKRLPLLQAVFNRYGVRPTYLVSYPVATDRDSIEILGGFCRDKLCEIGTHPHPWNTPPGLEHKDSFHSYISNLPSNLQRSMISTLHDVIVKNFDVTPQTYRSGRWGFSADVAKNLVQLGYKTDTSITPYADWSCSSGPDYTKSTRDPFAYIVEDAAGNELGRLLEVPATIGYLQSNERLANAAYWTLKRKMWRGDLAIAVLSKVGMLNSVCLSPETSSASQMIDLAQSLAIRGTKVLNMFLHSPSLLENCTPFVKTSSDVTAFIERIERFIAFARSVGIACVTMADLHIQEACVSSVVRLAVSPQAN